MGTIYGKFVTHIAHCFSVCVKAKKNDFLSFQHLGLQRFSHYVTYAAM